MDEKFDRHVSCVMLIMLLIYPNKNMDKLFQVILLSSNQATMKIKHHENILFYLEKVISKSTIVLDACIVALQIVASSTVLLVEQY